MFRLEKGDQSNLKGECIIYTKNPITSEVYAIHVCNSPLTSLEFVGIRQDEESRQAWEIVEEQFKELPPQLYVKPINMGSLDTQEYDLIFAGYVTHENAVESLLTGPAYAYIGNYSAQQENSLEYEHDIFEVLQGDANFPEDEFIMCAENIDTDTLSAFKVYYGEEFIGAERRQTLEFEINSRHSIEEVLAEGMYTVYLGKMEDKAINSGLEQMVYSFIHHSIQHKSMPVLPDSRTCEDYLGGELRSELKIRAKKIQSEDVKEIELAVEEMKRFTEGTPLYTFAIQLLIRAQTKHPCQQEIINLYIDQMVAIQSEEYRKAGELKKKLDDLLG